MERFVFAYEGDNGVVSKTSGTVIVDPVSVQQVIERVFAFLEASGVDAELIDDAASDVLMERFHEATTIEVDETPFKLEIAEEDDGYGIGI